jgi:hypothetical protein
MTSPQQDLLISGTVSHDGYRFGISRPVLPAQKAR